MKKKLILMLIVPFAGATFLTGCSGADDGGGNPPPVASVDDQIKAIQANKDMPPQAKEIAIAQVKARSASGMPKPSK